MAAPPKPLNFRLDSLGNVPEWAQSVFESLNTFASQVNQALGHGISRSDNLAASEKLDLTFTTEAIAANTFPIKVSHGLSNAPKHLVCTKLGRVDGAVITNAYSMTWSATSGGQVQVSFQGLDNSTKYRVNLTFE